ncbi:glycolate oxidase subunit GlcE [Salinisphaera aquimarina]|uniref:Glycolate oxidase subunit GlcE n=1 Tax=Salinisphaera aquimarina TaxID=2094031 RepID=A0ABV7ESQ1_9GAMM
MTSTADLTNELTGAVAQAFNDQTPLLISAGGSKSFLGERSDGELLDVTGHRGIVSYEPGELVMTARAGTPLAEIEAALADKNQMLAFEPPHYGDNATLGGTIAAGVSGPARPFTGSARDFVLGTRIINGRGEALRFGGEVMKNVAGYDLSRLMAGAFGTLGVLLDVSLKVLPLPREQVTLMFEKDADGALAHFSECLLKPWPITAAYWEAGRSYLRLAGAATSVESASKTLGGERLDDDKAFWQAIREHKSAFFQDERPLWRLSVAPATPTLDIEGDCVVDWGGAQRWLLSNADAATIRERANELGGHATCYRGDASPRFHPLPDAMLAVHKRVKQSLDPAGILNRGRLYSDF